MSQMFKNLDIWKEAIDLAEDVYVLTRTFPKEEQFGLTSQLRRAAVSVSANVAEGAGRSTPKDYMRFVFIATGSLNEVESLLAIALRIGYLDADTHKKMQNKCTKVHKLLAGFKKYLSEKAS